MKKIDLHIHTVQTPSDPNGFTFDLEVLKDYIISSKLDAIAITNHNAFYKDVGPSDSSASYKPVSSSWSGSFNRYRSKW